MCIGQRLQFKQIKYICLIYKKRTKIYNNKLNYKLISMKYYARQFREIKILSLSCFCINIFYVQMKKLCLYPKNNTISRAQVR